MAKRTITQRYIIECISPIHIPSKEGSLLPVSYVTLDNTCYVIDLNKLISEKKELIVDFRAELEEQKDKFSLKDFLRNHDILDKEFVKKISLYSAETPEEIETGVVYPYEKNAFNDPYITADSIKEGLRIGLLADRIQRYMKSPRKLFLSTKRSRYYRKFKRRRKREIDRLLKDIRNGKLNRWRELSDTIFKKYDLPKENILNKPEDYNDILRTIFITDTLKAGNPFIYPTYGLEKKKGKLVEKDSQSKTYRECLKPGTSVETRLTFDIKLWRKFSGTKERLRLPFSNLVELFKKANRFYRKIWDHEYRYWSKVKKKKNVPKQTLSSFAELQKLKNYSFKKKEKQINITGIKKFYSKKPNKDGYLLNLGGTTEEENIIVMKALKLSRNSLPRSREVITDHKHKRVIYPMGWILLYRQ